MNAKKLSSTAIKNIAVALMVCDHIHQMFVQFNAPIWLTWLGRPVFVMFLFAAAEGFYYTRSKRKYLGQMLCASACMTLLTFITQSILPNGHVVLMNNAFATFLVAGIYMLIWDRFSAALAAKQVGKVVTSVLLALVPVVAALPFLLASSFISNLATGVTGLWRALLMVTMVIPNILTIEGGALMVLIGVGFYIMRRWRGAQIAFLAVCSLAVFMINKDASCPWLMIFAAIPMFLYNGEKGKGNKWFFYIFYPTHIIALYIIATLYAQHAII
jgi:hypothetical protein